MMKTMWIFWFTQQGLNDGNCIIVWMSNGMNYNNGIWSGLNNDDNSYDDGILRL